MKCWRIPCLGRRRAHPRAWFATPQACFSHDAFAAGRIGGLTTSKEVADYARERGVTYVNHTFTSPLALSASLQPWADHPAGAICE